MSGPTSLHNRSSKDPTDVLAEAEQQWIYTKDELSRAPSVVDGMPEMEELTLRSKAQNFITNVGIMLKLPQTTLATATVFCNRFLMRMSLKKRPDKPGYVPLHHYQIAAISLFIATKVEEHTRKLKELVIACVRVALKKPDLAVDEQTRDFWRWRDTIIYNEDLVLEMLAFDLTIDSPYKVLWDLMRATQVHHNKKLRDAAWAFLNDTYLTQACLLYTSKTIAATALYFGAKSAGDGIDLPNGSDGSPWYRAQRVKFLEVKSCMDYMADFFESSPNAPQRAPDSQLHPYSHYRTSDGGMSDAGTSPALSVSPRGGSYRPSPMGHAEAGVKRIRMDDEEDGQDRMAGVSSTNGDDRTERSSTNGHKPPAPRIPPGVPRVPPAAKKQKVEEAAAEDDDGSEEGEI